MVLIAALTAACGGDGNAPPSTAAGGATSAPSSSTSPVLAPSAFGPGVLPGVFVDEDVAESSGLVASRRNPGRLWTHNDSDTPADLFCVEHDGTSCGTWAVTGAANVDWEDIAAGPGPDPGEDYLYIGDIGDNTESRDGIDVYRVAEPAVPEEGGDGATAPAVALRLRYDDGPHNAESLMVHPSTGAIYVVTKALGEAVVYRAPPEGGVLTQVATLALGLFGFATGGDISPDGRRVALTTPAGGFELTAPSPAAADFDAVWAQRPAPVVLPERPQGESIAYRLDGNALLLTSEGYPSPLYEVPRA